jgi:hypothetical protein
MRITRFVRCQDGVVTFDWIVLLGALTVTGLILLQLMTGAMSDHASTAADELQNPHFESDWAELPQG